MRDNGKKRGWCRMLPTSECDFDNLKIELSVRKFRPYNRINQTFRIFFSYFNVINRKDKRLQKNFRVPSVHATTPSTLPIFTHIMSLLPCLSHSFLVTLHTTSSTSNNFKIQQNDEETDFMRTGRMAT